MGDTMGDRMGDAMGPLCCTRVVIEPGTFISFTLKYLLTGKMMRLDWRCGKNHKEPP